MKMLLATLITSLLFLDVFAQDTLCPTTSCELIVNGDMESPSNEQVSMFGLNSFLGDLCGWQTYFGTSDIFPSELNASNHYATGQSGWSYSEAITSNAMALTSGNTYVLEFDYAISVWGGTTSVIGEMDSISLFLLENAYDQSLYNFTFEDLALNKIHIGTIENLQTDFFYTGASGNSPEAYFHHYSMTFVAPNDTSVRRLLLYPRQTTVGQSSMHWYIDNVSVSPLIEVELTASSEMISAGECVDLFAEINTNLYSWNPPISFSNPPLIDPTVCPATTSSYTIIAYDSISGCYRSDSITIVVLEGQMESGLMFPNVFTPNGDDINDFFIPVQQLGSIKSMELKILTRWGDMVYSSFDENVKWDGNYNGQSCTEGTYFWTAKIVDPIAGLKKVSGYVQLVR